MSMLRKKMERDMTIRRFASTTQESYIRAVADLAKYYMISPDKLTEEQLLNYIHFLITDRKLSGSSVNVVTAGLRFFYRETLKLNKMAVAIPPKKTSKKLPEVFNHDELKRLFSNIENQKHRMMLMTAYAGGLRISEVIRLKVKDIDSNRMVIRIDNSKGAKDRYTILSQRLLVELRDYWKNYRPQNFLFPNPIKDAPLNRATPDLVFRKAKESSNIIKNVTFHSLRHTFATNLLEAGVDIRTIQILLGHSSIISTTIYLHIARKNISVLKSPLDLIDMSNVDKIKQLIS